MVVTVQSKVSLKSTEISGTITAQNLAFYPEQQIHQRNVSGHVRRSMFRVKLSEDYAAHLPLGATILSVKLFWQVLAVSGTGVLTVDTYNESPNASGTIDINTVTWNSRSVGVPWATPGGDLTSPQIIPNLPMNAAGWYNIDITAWALESLTGNEKWIIFDTPVASTRDAVIATEHDIDPADQPYLEIIYAPSNLSALGRFQLGNVQLGASLGNISHSESIKVSEGQVFNMIISNSESMEVQDSFYIDMIVSLLEQMELLQELTWYPALNEVGVQVRITQLIDITWEDFCTWIQEAGHAIQLNDENARAFVNVQQREQTFRGNVKVYPGDAVMFSCPTLLVKIGDTVKHDFREYEVIEQHNKLVGGNYIYIKSALRLKSLAIVLPKVTGLTASANTDGTVTLTWDDISKTIYTFMDHFEIWRSPLHPIVALNQVLKTFTVDGEWAEYFSEDDEITIAGSTGNNGTYTVVEAVVISGQTVITVEEAIPSAIADGRITELTFRLAGTTKNPSFTDKGLVPGAFYYYIVRAIDKYGNDGEFSDLIFTEGEFTQPPKPEGFR